MIVGTMAAVIIAEKGFNPDSPLPLWLVMLAVLFLTTFWSFEREFSRNGPDPPQFHRHTGRHGESCRDIA